MADTLQVEARDSFGSRATQRLRDSGKVPMILYGHGEQTMHLAVAADAISAVIRHGGKLVELTGAVKDSAFVKDVQWGPLGNRILHLDLTRVSAHEKVKVTVPIELRGEAPGTKEGGIIEHVQHDVEILCPAQSLPERLQLRISEMHLDGALYASDLTLPEGASLITPPDTLIVHCVMPTAAEEEAVPGEEAEPEVIGRKEGEEGESED